MVSHDVDAVLNLFNSQKLVPVYDTGHCEWSRYYLLNIDSASAPLTFLSRIHEDQSNLSL